MLYLQNYVNRINHEDCVAASLDRLIAAIVMRPSACRWQGWDIQPITGGMNNLVYRTTSEEQDLAIKLCRCDARDRAGREFAALHVLNQLGLDIAPCPIALDRGQYVYPVVVQSWLAGETIDTPPVSDHEWDALLQHFVTLHQVTPERWQGLLLPAVTNIASVAQGRAMFAEQIGMLPPEAWPDGLDRLVTLVEQVVLTEPGGARIALCHVDANTRNFVRRDIGWAAVDWENSGWGEPAFEIVDMMTHPAYAAVRSERWDWVIQRYTELSGDGYAPAKIVAFYPLMLAWWAVRTARLIYELPRGLDVRLSGTAELQANLDQQYQRYLASAMYVLQGDRVTR
jgi:aminoglycoside phosphotransferase (APT) family kinase protein